MTFVQFKTTKIFNDETFNFMTHLMGHYPVWYKFIYRNSEESGKHLHQAIKTTFDHLPQIKNSHDITKINPFQIMTAVNTGVLDTIEY